MENWVFLLIGRCIQDLIAQGARCAHENRTAAPGGAAVSGTGGGGTQSVPLRGGGRGSVLHHRAGGERLEEVVALVVDEDEGREVLDLDLVDCLHAELRILDELHLLDVLLGEDGGGAADRAEVEAAVLLAGVGDLLRPVALGEHDERAAVALEEVDVAVHAAGGGGTCILFISIKKAKGKK